MSRSICAVLLIAIAILGIGRGVLAAPVVQPAVAACYATDGVNVETTYISGGGAYIYPGPSDVEIEPLADGAFVVHHSTRFVPIGARVYLPRVMNP